MSRKEEILQTTLELAAQQGLDNVTMSQIAENVGIQKASLYNHFSSRDEIIEQMYYYLEDQLNQADHSNKHINMNLLDHFSAEEALDQIVRVYLDTLQEENYLQYYNILSSRRGIEPQAAKMMADKTNRLIDWMRNNFSYLEEHEVLVFGDLDQAAMSFSLTMMGILDHQKDLELEGERVGEEAFTEYIRYFVSMHKK